MLLQGWAGHTRLTRSMVEWWRNKDRRRKPKDMLASFAPFGNNSPVLLQDTQMTSQTTRHPQQGVQVYLTPHVPKTRVSSSPVSELNLSPVGTL